MSKSKPRGYPEVDKSVREISFSVNAAYRTRPDYTKYQIPRLNREAFEVFFI